MATITERTWRDILQEAFEIAQKRDGLTQDRLADRLGVSQQTISNWITGARTPSIANFNRMMQACNPPQRVWLELRTTRPTSGCFRAGLAMLEAAAA